MRSADCVHSLGSENRPPRIHQRFFALLVQTLLDVTQLIFRNESILFWPLPNNYNPRNEPHTTNSAKHIKQALPSQPLGQNPAERHSNHRSRIVASKRSASHARSFLGRCPSRPHGMDARKRDTLRNALDDAHHNQCRRAHVGRPRCEQCQHSGHANAASENLTSVKNECYFGWHHK